MLLMPSVALSTWIMAAHCVKGLAVADLLIYRSTLAAYQTMSGLARLPSVHSETDSSLCSWLTATVLRSISFDTAGNHTPS